METAEKSESKMQSMKSADFDDLLDEIDDQTRIVSTEKIDNGIINWNKIIQEMENGNINFIKNLITSKDIDINAQNPANGQTLLMYAIIIGNYDLVKVIINFGANVSIKDDEKEDALDHAIIYGRYKITELVYYQSLSGSLGKDLRFIATETYNKDEEAKYFIDKLDINIINKIIEFVINAIKERKSFSPDLLYYCWYYIVNNEDKEKSLQHPLWNQMMKTYQEILQNTSDKKGWNWLKEQFITSLIWYLPHPQYETKSISTPDDEIKNDDRNDIESVLKTTLFYELLKRLRVESKGQSDRLLKQKINKTKSSNPQIWNELITYNVNTKFSSNARQDFCGCLQPKYNKFDLSEKKYPSSTHFSTSKHYDTQIYLNQLLFNANLMDKTFQIDMKKIAADIGKEMGESIDYRAGPVKTLKRSQTKVENDYIAEDYPTSAKILDINRCALQFKTIKSMMTFIKLFTNKIKESKAYSIIDIIRCKNGWSVYKEEYPQYTDIKLNVLIKTRIEDKDTMIISEIQFLLDLMSEFKKKAHKLYSVERKLEVVYNFSNLRKKMKSFADNTEQYQVYLELINRDALDKLLNLMSFEQISLKQLFLLKPSNIKKAHLFNHLLGDIIMKNGQILKQLSKGNNEKHVTIKHGEYGETITEIIRNWPKEISLFDKANKNEIELFNTLIDTVDETIFHPSLLCNDMNIMDTLYFIAKNNRLQKFKFIVNNQGLNVLIPNRKNNNSSYIALLNIIKQNDEIFKYLIREKQKEYEELLSNYAKKYGFGYCMNDKVFWKLLLDSIPNELKVELLTAPFNKNYERYEFINDNKYPWFSEENETIALNHYLQINSWWDSQRGCQIYKLKCHDELPDLLSFLLNELKSLSSQQKIKLLLQSELFFFLCIYRGGNAENEENDYNDYIYKCLDPIFDFIANDEEILVELFVNNGKDYDVPNRNISITGVTYVEDITIINYIFSRLTQEMIQQSLSNTDTYPYRLWGGSNNKHINKFKK